MWDLWLKLRSDISISIFPTAFQEKTYNFVEIIGPMIQFRFKLQHVLSRAIKISKISTENIIVYLFIFKQNVSYASERTVCANRYKCVLEVYVCVYTYTQRDTSSDAV